MKERLLALAEEPLFCFYGKDVGCRVDGEAIRAGI